MALDDTELSINDADVGQDRTAEPPFDYAKRAQWLRAAVLGANDGLVSTACLMMGVGAVKSDTRAMVLSGLAGLVAGACSMAIGEFVSVYSQFDVEVAAQIMRKREERQRSGVDDEEEERLPNPLQAAAASGLAFSVGAAVPLLAAGFVSSYKVRAGAIAAGASLSLAVFGIVGAVLGNTPVGRSCGRVVAGGWMAMAVTFGMMKLFGSRGL